jgi:acetyl-CoA acetyltransferase
VAEVYVVGVGITPFRRWSDRTLSSLASEAVAAALSDAGDARPEVVVCGSCTAHAWGQPNVRGPALLREVRDRFVPHAPVFDVEAGCATGVLALHGAIREVLAGADVALAVGVDKTYLPDAAAIGALFEGATDRLAGDETRAFWAAEAARVGVPFAPEPGRSILLDVAAVQARWHQQQHGTPVEAFAAVAAKNRAAAAHNERALLRSAIPAADILADRAVIAPFTRSMCAPIADGAGAVLVASGEEVRRRGWTQAVRVRGLGLAGGTLRPLDAPSESVAAGARAWAAAGVEPEDIDVAEVHDATSFAELAALEALGFRAPGAAAEWALRGGTSLGGECPVNPSGGLVARGHALAASGLAMVHEIATQLRGRAGARQVEGARLGLVHNAGGLVGFDEALCGVVVLEA